MTNPVCERCGEPKRTLVEATTDAIQIKLVAEEPMRRLRVCRSCARFLAKLGTRPTPKGPWPAPREPRGNAGSFARGGGRQGTAK